MLAADSFRPTAEVAVSADVVYHRGQICEAYVHRGSDSGVQNLRVAQNNFTLNRFKSHRGSRAKSSPQIFALRGRSISKPDNGDIS